MMVASAFLEQRRSEVPWRVLPETAVGSTLSDRLGIHPVTAQILWNRGLKTLEQAKRFLSPEPSLLGDPFAMRGMSGAIGRLEQALAAGETMCIYGDYDVDGLTATAILLNTFTMLGVPISAYIPDRLDEGYGVHAEALEDIREDGASLVITVDSGMSARHEVDVAKSLGLDVIVTDHHQDTGLVPDTWVVNPHQSGCAYPFKGLSGAGVALQLVRALAIRGILGAQGTEWAISLIDLAALGTLADQVPLLEDNRVIAKMGLNLMRESPSPGLKALLDSKGSLGLVDEFQVVYGIAPRLNAAGRMGSPRPALDLLITKDPEKAKALAEELEIRNLERQATEAAVLEEADHMLRSERSLLSGVLVLAAPGWHRGVLGIVASRLVDAYGHPALIISLEGDTGRGSGRSVPGFDLLESLRSCSDLLSALGGHSQAAGIEVPKARIDDLRARLSRSVIPACAGEIVADASVELGGITSGLCGEMGLLAPFGQANPRPLLVTSAWVASSRLVGKTGSHLQMGLTDQREAVSLPAVAFGVNRLPEDRGGPMEFLLRVEMDTWQGKRRPRAIVEGMRPEPDWVESLFDKQGSEGLFAKRVLGSWSDTIEFDVPARPSRHPVRTGDVPQDQRWQAADWREVLDAVIKHQGKVMIVLPDARQVMCWSRHLLISDGSLGVASAHGLVVSEDPVRSEVMVVSREYYRDNAPDLGKVWSMPSVSVFPQGIDPEPLDGASWVLEDCGVDVAIMDVRGSREQLGYLKSVVEETGRCFVYVNTPARAAKMAETLREAVGGDKHIMYYHPGLGDQVRSILARRFEQGDLTVLVGTGPEGIRGAGFDVVFWDMPLGAWEFRSSVPLAVGARAHLLYGAPEAARAERTIRGVLPDRDLLVDLYRALKSGQAAGCATPEDLAKQTRSGSPASLRQGVAVLVDLGLVDKGEGESWSLSLRDVEDKRDLANSLRYREAALILQGFEAWRGRALGTSLEELCRTV